MERYRLAFYGTAAALVVSVLLHLRPWWEEPPGAASSVDAAAPTALPEPSGPPRTSPTTAEIAAAFSKCRAELAACRKSSWDIAMKAIRADVRERSSQFRADGGAPRAEAEPFDERRKALCRLSEQFLRHAWSANRDQLMGLIQDFGTEAWSENWSAYKSESIGEMFDLSSSQQEALQQGYDSLWRQHGPRLQRMLASERTDYDALLGAAQEYFRAEDRLVDSVLGSQVQAQYGQSELEVRTLVLAILGTFADQPWSDALAW